MDVRSSGSAQHHRWVQCLVRRSGSFFPPHICCLVFISPFPCMATAELTTAGRVLAGLMAANLAGFVLGLDGLSAFLSELLQDPRFLAATFVVFFCAAQCMFWLRQRRSGSQGS